MSPNPNPDTTCRNIAGRSSRMSALCVSMRKPHDASCLIRHCPHELGDLQRLFSFECPVQASHRYRLRDDGRYGLKAISGKEFTIFAAQSGALPRCSSLVRPATRRSSRTAAAPLHLIPSAPRQWQILFRKSLKNCATCTCTYTILDRTLKQRNRDAINCVRHRDKSLPIETCVRRLHCK